MKGVLNMILIILTIYYLWNNNSVGATVSFVCIIIFSIINQIIEKNDNMNN